MPYDKNGKWVGSEPPPRTSQFGVYSYSAQREIEERDEKEYNEWRNDPDRQHDPDELTKY